MLHKQGSHSKRDSTATSQMQFTTLTDLIQHEHYNENDCNIRHDLEISVLEEHARGFSDYMKYKEGK